MPAKSRASPDVCLKYHLMTTCSFSKLSITALVGGHREILAWRATRPVQREALSALGSYSSVFGVYACV